MDGGHIYTLNKMIFISPIFLECEDSVPRYFKDKCTAGIRTCRKLKCDRKWKDIARSCSASRVMIGYRTFLLKPLLPNKLKNKMVRDTCLNTCAVSQFLVSAENLLFNYECNIV